MIVDSGTTYSELKGVSISGRAELRDDPETLDAFADALLRIRNEDSDFLHNAPHSLAISRPDEVKAAKEPVLRWKGNERTR